MAELLKVILRLRTRLRQTQAGMARMIGCSVRQYCRWEEKEFVPGPHYLWKVLDLCPDEKSGSVLISGLVLKKPDKRYKGDTSTARDHFNMPPLTDALERKEDSTNKAGLHNAKAKGKRHGRPRALGPRSETLPDREFLADCGVEYFDKGDSTRRE